MLDTDKVIAEQDAEPDVAIWRVTMLSSVYAETEKRGRQPLQWATRGADDSE